jgi:putative redox protein
MPQIDLTWIDEQRFLGVDSSGHSMVLSPPNDVGVKPSETLLIALAACAAHDVVEILRKQRLPLQRLAVRVTATQAADPPWAYQQIHLRFQVQAPGVKARQLERAIDLALNTYCSVRASLAPTIAVTFDTEILEPGNAESSRQ